jgi:ABC-type lipoprotein export system ATPase subunit
VSAIRIEGVWKRRGSGARSIEVLRDVSLSIEAGELVLLLGPSGSGKTTLLGIAAGLLSPDAGSVAMNGIRLDGTSQSERRALRSTRIGFIFQRPNLLSGLTARENIRLMATLAGIAHLQSERETDAVLERLGIRDLAGRLPHELSGGEEQRVGIARALVHRPPVVLADEPTGSLDAVAGTSVAELLFSVAAERQSAVLVATHDMRLERYASRQLHMTDGRVGQQC